MRLLGFGVNDLGDTDMVQGNLFGEPERDKQRQLDRVADEIAVKFGKAAIRRGAGLEGGKR